MECIYNRDDFCTNDQCPARGDFCPVPEIEGICQYEEREDAAYVLAPKGCLMVALLDCDVEMREETFNEVWEKFSELMIRFGYVEGD